MKMSITGRLYPTMMKAVLKAELKKRLSVSEAEEAIKAADKEYEKIIERTPEMGGDKNPMAQSLYLGAYAVALFKQLKDRMTIQAMGEMIAEGLQGAELVRRLAGKTDYLSADYMSMLQKNASWLAAQRAQGSWAFQASGEVNKRLIIRYTQCGFWELVKREGVPEAASLLCKTDGLVYGLSGFTMCQDKCFDADGCCVISIERG